MHPLFYSIDGPDDFLRHGSAGLCDAEPLQPGGVRARVRHYARGASASKTEAEASSPADRAGEGGGLVAIPCWAWAMMRN